MSGVCQGRQSRSIRPTAQGRRRLAVPGDKHRSAADSYDPRRKIRAAAIASAFPSRAIGWLAMVWSAGGPACVQDGSPRLK